MPEGFEVKFTGAKRRRRVRFERRSLGEWVRVEYEFRDGRWRRTGQELVDEVSVEVDRDVLDDAVDVIFPDQPGTETVGSPEGASRR